MRYFLDRMVLILSLTILLIPFNNCSQSDNRLFLADQGSASENGGLKVSISGPTSLQIPTDLQTFTIQGSCDPGVYYDTEIYWKLLSGTNVIIDSMMAGGPVYMSSCLNKSYQIQVRVPCPGVVNSGSNCFGITQKYVLEVHIEGLNASGFPEVGAHAQSNRITLVP